MSDVPLDERRYILQDRAGHYVATVEPTGYETIKLRFLFVRLEKNAKRFSFDDLCSPLATTSVAGEFIRGYCGKMVRVK